MDPQPIQTTFPPSLESSDEIISALRLFIQNISDQLYNYNGSIFPTMPDFPAIPEIQLPAMPNQPIQALNDMRNLTLTMFSAESGEYFYPSAPWDLDLDLMIHQLLSLILTVGLLWALNKSLLKSSIAHELLETILALLIAAPALPAILLAALTIWLVRATVSLWLKLRFGEKARLLSPVDGFWAYEQHASCSSCLGLYVIEGKCNPATIMERMEATVWSPLVAGKLSKRLTSHCGFYAWEDIPKSEMKMEDYVKVVLNDTENNNKGGVVGERDVMEFMSSIQDRPLVFSNLAPWEVFIVPKYNHEGGVGEHYAVIYRIHHSIMDGISTGNVLHSVMADKPFKFSLDPTHPQIEKLQMSPAKTALVYLLGFLCIPRVFFRNSTLLDNPKNRWWLPGRQLRGPKCLTWTRPINMQALKAIKDRSQTSVYSVLLSAMGGAYLRYKLRQYKQQQGLSEEEADGWNKIHIMSPIALLPYPDRQPRNRFTGVVVPSLLGRKDTEPLERLTANYNNLRELGSASASYLAVANWYYPCILGALPRILHWPLSSVMHLTMSLSNVPGPAEDVYIYNGGKIINIGIWLPIKFSMGLGMGLFSYKDHVRATLIGDAAYYPGKTDVQQLAKAFEHELSKLASAVGLSNVFIET